MASSSASPFLDRLRSSPVSTSDPCSSSNDCTWDDIDLAERYLVSSQFEEAAALASTVLKKLKGLDDAITHPGHLAFQGEDANEINDVLESAAMVLIQAYSETSRSSEIFEVLETAFGSVGDVPPSIILAGVCLQMSAGLFRVAQVAIEAFLQHWIPSSVNGECYILKLAENQNHKPAFLKVETYVEISEIYCTQVLAKGLRRLDTARKWAREADIPGDRKQDILEKLERISLIQDAKRTTGSLSQCKRTECKSTTACSDLQARSLVSEVGEQVGDNRAKKRTPKDADSQTLRNAPPFSPLVGLLSRFMTTSSVGDSLYASRRQKLLTIIVQRKMVFNGAATIFLICVVYKQRHKLKGLLQNVGWVLRNFWHAIHVGFVDLWQLAFNVELNPLAAVQPLSSLHHGVTR